VSGSKPHSASGRPARAWTVTFAPSVRAGAANLSARRVDDRLGPAAGRSSLPNRR
jgi:hypothetical protein